MLSNRQGDKRTRVQQRPPVVIAGGKGVRKPSQIPYPPKWGGASAVRVSSILHVGILLVLAAPAEDLLAQLPYSLGASFADLGRAFSGADSDVLAGTSGAFAEIAGGVARMQGNEISGGSGRAFAQALRPLACALANVLTALPDFLAGAGLNLLVLALRRGLPLRGPLILRRIRGACKYGQTQKQQQQGACRHKRREFGFNFYFPFS